MRRPDPALHLAELAQLAATTSGAQGRIVLHSAAMSQPSSRAWKAVLTPQREAPQGRGSTVSAPAGSLRSASLGFFSSADHALCWHLACRPVFKSGEIAGMGMP